MLSPGDTGRLLYCYALGFAELLDNCRLNILDTFKAKQKNLDTSNFNDVTGKVCVVTGANAGVGLVTARLLAERGAHIIMACRSLSAAEQAATSVRAAACAKDISHPQVEIMPLDLASLKSVNSFCDEFKKRNLDLSVLVCNAGVMRPPKRLETEDGLERQFQVNYLGHWMIANRLVTDHIRRRKKGELRIVFVSSMTHIGGKIDFEDINANKSYEGTLRYADSKLASIIGAREFQRRFDRLEGKRHSAVSVHPGLLDTSLARQYFKGLYPSCLQPVTNIFVDAVFVPLALRNVIHGGHAELAACLRPTQEIAGEYMALEKIGKSPKAAIDPLYGAQLWELSTKLSGLEKDDILT